MEYTYYWCTTGSLGRFFNFYFEIPLFLFHMFVMSRGDERGLMGELCSLRFVEFDAKVRGHILGEQIAIL